MPYYAIVPKMLPLDLVRRVRACIEPDIDKIDARGQFPPATRLDPIMREVAMSLGAYPLLQALLSSSWLHCHWPPMARCVRPDDSDALWSAHRDTQYNVHIKGPFVSVWLPLVSIDAICGGIDIRDPALVSAPLMLAPLEPGDAIVLSDDCLHQSMPNKSERLRLSCDFRFFDRRLVRTEKPYLDTASGVVVMPC